MVERNPERCNDIYNLLSLHDFAMNNNVSEELKCNKCLRVLVNACQAPCRCRYCLKCINEILNECDICPGNTEFCKDEPLSNYHTDYVSNKEILKLVVKCPEELCPHECELINMEEHLRLCSNQRVKCPFYGLGCNEEKLVADKMGQHLQLEAHNHNRILIDMIGDLKNELNLVKQKIEKHDQEIQDNKDQIDILKDHSRMKDEAIAEMNIKIQSHEDEIQRNKTRIEQLEERSNTKDEAIAKMQQDQIRAIKEEKQQMETKINNLKKESENKMANLREEMTKEWQDGLGREVSRINDEMEKRQDKPIEAPFSWKVDQISDKKQNGANIFSEIFYRKSRPYKMKLRMVSYAGSDQLNIRLFIDVDKNDAHLEWPFQGNVTIQISNLAHPNASQLITKYCNIPRPNNNSSNCSDTFQFSYAELSTAGLLNNNFTLIECRID